MNVLTRNKLNEIVQLVKNGTPEKEIIKIKFGRNNKRMRDWIKKLDPELTPEEREILSFKINQTKKHDLEVQNNDNLSEVSFKAIQLLEEHEKRLKALEDKLGPHMDELEVLTIDNDILKLKSVIKSVRINQDLINEFNLIAGKYPNYSKTNLLNQAIKDFIKKYK